MTHGRFPNRRSAGLELGDALAEEALDDPLVIGLPRGGVPVAAAVAERLGAPLDALVVRKVGAPFNPELAIGAVGEGGALVIHPGTVQSVGAGEAEVERQVGIARDELERLVRRLRDGRPPAEVRGRQVVLVDDGIATGSTVEAAVHVLKDLGARRIVLAVPVSSPEAVEMLRPLVDEIVALAVPRNMYAVGAAYDDFSAVSSDEVSALLETHGSQPPGPPDGVDDAHPTDGAGAVVGSVVIPAGGVELAGDLNVPSGAQGIVVFAHGSGSSRLSPRNREVAAALNRGGLATLLFDLLTEPEAADRGNVFDVELLAGRLAAVTQWLRAQPGVGELAVGYFGASTGAAAALVAAAEHPAGVGAVVSRGGRPDLAGDHLVAVRAPTLLIVGSRDSAVLELNEAAASELVCEHDLAVVPGATHLFEEPGTLEEVARLALDWFARRLS